MSQDGVDSLIALNLGPIAVESGRERTRLILGPPSFLHSLHQNALMYRVVFY